MLAVSLVLVAALSPFANQSADFSGTWLLDEAASNVVRAAGLAGMGEGGAPTALHITQAPNGNFLVSSRVNGAGPRFYQIGGETTVPDDNGERVTASARWEGGALLVEGGDGDNAFRERYTLGPGGSALTIEVSIAGDGQLNTLVYRRAG